MSDPQPPARLHDPMCMVCGPENPNSLGMRARIDGDHVLATAKLEVEYRAPAMLGTPIEMCAWCERIDGRKLYLRGEIRQGGNVVVEASALFIHVDVSHWASSGVPLPDGWHTWGAGTVG